MFKKKKQLEKEASAYWTVSATLCFFAVPFECGGGVEQQTSRFDQYQQKPNKLHWKLMVASALLTDNRIFFWMPVLLWQLDASHCVCPDFRMCQD